MNRCPGFLQDHPLAPSIDAALAACAAAAAELAPRFGRTETAATKDDGSPVTEADQAASAAAVGLLRARFPDDCTISEEAPPPAGWRDASRLWLVDPLDGTREFVQAIPEYCVMVALCELGMPILGVVADPARGRTWLGLVGTGAWELDAGGGARPVHVATTRALRGARELVSRHQDDPEVAAWSKDAHVGERRLLGSIGLKAAQIASGEADFYFRRPSERRCAPWDSGPAAALVIAAGGNATAGDGTILRYDGPELGHDGVILCGDGLFTAILGSWTLRGIRQRDKAASRPAAPACDHPPHKS